MLVVVGASGKRSGVMLTAAAVVALPMMLTIVATADHVVMAIAMLVRIQPFSRVGRSARGAVEGR